MAERRMFAKCIVESDAFLDMPLTTQALYLHLGMNADDDGFVGSPKKVVRECGANEDDLKILLGKRFILGFETGIVVIKHWKMNNYIQKDRYKKTVYQEELKTLQVKNNGSYTELDTNCIQNGYNLDTQVRLGKVSIGKDNNKVSKKENKKSFDELIDNFTKNPELREELKNHLIVRKQKKASLTNRAIELELKTLQNLSQNEEVQIEIVRQSIERGWIGFFEVKNSKHTNDDTEKRVMKALYGNSLDKLYEN